MNSTTFVSFPNETVSGIVTCMDKQLQILFKGFMKESLDPGCVLMVWEVTFVSAMDPNIEEKQLVSLFKGIFFSLLTC